jgi:hypothetical protein
MNKLKQTNLAKYGVENPLKNAEIKQKATDTIISKYGTTNVMLCEEVKEKIKITNNEKYGCDYATQSPEVREKTEKTSLEKYGVKCNLMLEANKDQVKKTNLEKYGTEYSLQNEGVKQKGRMTCIEKYGVEYPNQNKEQFEKTQKSSKKYKNYTFPSGAIRRVQGYEPFALSELIKIFTEEQIKTDRADIPTITYNKDGKSKYYFPDIFIPHEKKIIEVKSTWTYKSKLDSIQEKAAATKAAGYNYEIWEYDAKANKIIHT